MTLFRNAMLAAVIWMCSVPSGIAQKAPSEVFSTTVSGMEISLRYDRTEIVVGEPVYIELTVRNRSATTRAGNFGARLFYPEGNDIKLMIQRPGELPYRYEGTERSGMLSSVEYSIREGEAVRNLLPVIFDRNRKSGYVFDIPGQFTLSASLSFIVFREPQPTKLIVPPTVISVKAPEGSSAEAFKLIADQDSARSLHALGAVSPEVLAKLEKLSQNYPDTPYAPLASYTAATTYARAKKEYDKAIQLFHQYIKRYPGSVRENDAIYSISLAYASQNQMDKARDCFLYLMDHDPTYHMLRSDTPLAWELVYGVTDKVNARHWWLYSKPWDVAPAPRPGSSGPSGASGSAPPPEQ